MSLWIERDKRYFRHWRHKFDPITLETGFWLTKLSSCYFSSFFFLFRPNSHCLRAFPNIIFVPHSFPNTICHKNLMTLWHLSKRNFSNFCILFISQSTRYTNWGTQGDRKGWDDDKIQMIVELALLHIFRKTGYLSWHICQKCGVRLLPISISPKIEHDVHCSGLNMAYKSLKTQTI